VTELNPKEDQHYDELQASIASALATLLKAREMARARRPVVLPPIALTVPQTAEVLMLTADEVLDLIHTNVLPARKLGGRWSISSADVLDHETRRCEEVVADRIQLIAATVG
jgi:excisionase family DNA binding protein